MEEIDRAPYERGNQALASSGELCSVYVLTSRPRTSGGCSLHVPFVVRSPARRIYYFEYSSARSWRKNDRQRAKTDPPRCLLFDRRQTIIETNLLFVFIHLPSVPLLRAGICNKLVKRTLPFAASNLPPESRAWNNPWSLTRVGDLSDRKLSQRFGGGGFRPGSSPRTTLVPAVTVRLLISVRF